MIYTELTKKAMLLAYQAHDGQTDKAGLPYIHHPLHVAETMPDELTTAAALLHDVVEDTRYTFDDLRSMGFPEELIDVLTHLTHGEDEPYADYLERVKACPAAVTVKYGDIAHNSDLSRMPAGDPKIEYLRDKYAKALKQLEGSKKI